MLPQGVSSPEELRCQVGANRMESKEPQMKIKGDRA